MGLSELCIRRPVLTTLVTATFIVFGLFSYRLLGVAALPAVEFPTIVINTNLPGASAETMASSVAAPIERQLSTISGINSLTSTSTLGRAKMTIQFVLDRNIDGAALDVQTALTVAQKRLPIEMTTPPSFNKTNPSESPVVLLAVRSATLPISVVDEYAENVLAQQITQLPGVSNVEVYGAQKYATRVQVDPSAAAARNISLDDIRRVLVSTNSNSPVGTLYGPNQNVTLVATNAMRKAEEYKNVIVAWRNGAPVKLEEIANVIDSVENNQVASWYNDKRAVVLAVQKQPGANAVAVVDSVQSQLPTYRAQVPAAIDLEVLADRSISIRNSVEDVEFTLGVAIVLVVLVIFLFLRSVPATIIPALAVPVSLIGTCAMMYALNFSINNMTMLALTLSVGFVVDDAIVMLENIVRYIEGGMRPFEAALKGSKEIGFTIVAITFSLIAVFIPVLLMGGMVGRVFREFAVTIAVAIIISGFVSLTLTPMLCARVLRNHHEGEKQNIRAAGVRGGSSIARSEPTNGRSTGCLNTSRSRSRSPSPPWPAPSTSTSPYPRASSRPRIPASSPPPPRRRRTYPSRPWSSCRPRSRTSSSRTRRSITSILRSAPAASIRPPIPAASISRSSRRPRERRIRPP